MQLFKRKREVLSGIGLKMNIENDLNFDELIAYYIFANTPYYLFKNFKNDNSIKDISQKYPANHMINEFNIIYDTESNDIKQKVKIYALLVALSYKEYSETKDFFIKLHINHFKWVKEFKNIIIDNYKATQQVIVNVSEKKFDNLANPKINVATSTFLKEHKMDIKIKGEPK